MKPKFQNPEPSDTKKPWATLDDVPQITAGQFDDDWTEHAQYELDGRGGSLKYPHVSVYDKSGSLKSVDNIFYRLIKCQVADIELAENDTLVMQDCQVTSISGGHKSHLVLKNVTGLESIRGLRDCYVEIEDCDISQLKITECSDKSQFRIHKGQSATGDFIARNTGCTFRLTEVKTTTAVPIKENQGCHFWLVDFESTTPVYTFEKNKNLVTKVKRSKFSGNDWVCSDDTDHDWYSQGTSYSCPHGFRGSKYRIVHQGETILLGKSYLVSDSEITVIGGSVGGELVFGLTNSRVFVTDASINGAPLISQSTASKFHFVNSALVASDTNFKDTNCDHHIDACSVVSSNNNYDGSNCRFKFEPGCSVVATTLNFTGTGSVTANQSSIKSSLNNFDGSWKLLQMESCSVTAATDCFVGSAEKMVANRVTATAGAHPFKFSIEEAEFDQSQFIAHSVLSCRSAKWRDSTFMGPATFGYLKSVDEVNTSYMDVATISDAHGKSYGCTFAAPVSYSGVSLTVERNTHAAPVSYSGAHLNIHDSSYAAVLDISCNVDIHNVTVGGVCTITGAMNIDNLTTASGAISGSGSIFNLTHPGSLSGSFSLNNVTVLAFTGVATAIGLTAASGMGGTVLSGGGVLMGNCAVPPGYVYTSGLIYIVPWSGC